MLKVELNVDEYNYLCRSIFVDPKYSQLRFSEQKYDKFLIKISEEQADDIRDLCGEQLQAVGFDEEYELTQDGVILETLIDKFFIG